MSFVADLDALVADSQDGRLACPAGWKRIRLGELATVLNGFPFQSSGFGSEGAPVIRIRDVTRGHTETRFSGEVPEGYWITAGDLLIGMDGDFACSKWHGPNALLNQRVCRVTPKKGAPLRLDFLAYALPAYLQLINDNTPSVTVKHLSSRTLQNIPLAVPSMEEQARLVSHIDTLFAEVAAGEEALAAAKASLGQWRQALLKAAVTGDLTADWRAANPPAETGEALLARILADRRTRWTQDQRNKGKRYPEPPAPDTTTLPTLPDGWTWASLAQLSFVVGGVTVDSKRKAVDPVTAPYMRVANVQRGHLSLENLKTITVERSVAEQLLLKPGDMLLNEGGDRDKIGRGWVFAGEVEGCLHQNHVFRARPASSLVLPKLCMSYLNELGRDFFIQQGKQTTNLASISLSKVSTAPIPVPPAAEAKLIMRMVEELEAEQASLLGIASDADGRANNLRQSILAAAFRGELAA